MYTVYLLRLLPITRTVTIKFLLKTVLTVLFCINLFRFDSIVKFYLSLIKFILFIMFYCLVLYIVLYCCVGIATIRSEIKIVNS